jgi:hypothetical protein
MWHDVMNVQTLSLLHNLMIVAILSAATPLAARQRGNGSIEQFATQFGEPSRAIHAPISTGSGTKVVVI